MRLLTVGYDGDSEVHSNVFLALANVFGLIMNQSIIDTQSVVNK